MKVMMNFEILEGTYMTVKKVMRRRRRGSTKKNLRRSF
jgi:hypothetical protein